MKPITKNWTFNKVGITIDVFYSWGLGMWFLPLSGPCDTLLVYRTLLGPVEFTVTHIRVLKS